MVPVLFVYGTLMRGEASHALLEGAPFLGTARTVAAFTLFDLDGYPGLVRGGTDAVIGELFDVSDALLVRLDRYEEVPLLYRRESIALADGAVAEAYVLAAEHARGRRRIASGDYRFR